MPRPRARRKSETARLVAAVLGLLCAPSIAVAQTPATGPTASGATATGATGSGATAAGTPPSTTGALPASPGEDPLFSTNRPRLRSGTPAQAQTRATTRRLPRNPARASVQAPVATLPDPTPDPVPIRRRRADEDPYAAIGLRAGGVVLYPTLDQTVGYDSNPNRAAGAGSKGSTVLRTDAEARLQSDWRTHALTGRLRGSYLYYPAIDGASRPELDGNLAYRHDFTRDTQAEFELRGRLDTQRPGSPELNVAVRDRPLVTSLGTTLGGTQRFNRLSFTLRGTLDRTAYEDASLTNGATLKQSDRNVTQLGLRLRAGYEVTPGLTPFVEALADRRVYDDSIDQYGFRRESRGVGARAGAAFEITRKLTGEAALGYLTRDYEDARLKSLRGATADAALSWSVSPVTTVRTTLATTLDETSLAGASGAITRRAGLELAHDFQRHIAMTAGVTASRTDYRGVRLTEDVVAGSLRLDYRFSRTLSARASYSHERLISSVPGADYTANIYLLGLRLQR